MLATPCQRSAAILSLWRRAADGQATDIRILDLDSAGMEGTARYGFGLNRKVKWPMRHPDGQHILAGHDRQLM